MPKAVLGAIVFLIGIDLIDIAGLRRIARRRRSEFVIAVVTAVVVCAVGSSRASSSPSWCRSSRSSGASTSPRTSSSAVSEAGQQTYRPATAGAQSEPGLIVFRYDAELFYANANRFVDDIENSIDKAPDKVRWLILDAGEPRRHRLLRRHRARRAAGLPRNPSDHVRHRPRRHGSSTRSARTTSSTGSGPTTYDTLDDAIEAFHGDTAAAH